MEVAADTGTETWMCAPVHILLCKTYGPPSFNPPSTTTPTSTTTRTTQTRSAIKPLRRRRRRHGSRVRRALYNHNYRKIFSLQNPNPERNDGRGCAGVRGASEQAHRNDAALCRSNIVHKTYFIRKARCSTAQQTVDRWRYFCRSGCSQKTDRIAPVLVLTYYIGLDRTCAAAPEIHKNQHNGNCVPYYAPCV